jgi:hypothetical protein
MNSPRPGHPRGQNRWAQWARLVMAGGPGVGEQIAERDRPGVLPQLYWWVAEAAVVTRTGTSHVACG